jgi:excinuclease UvrABC ATPase subunit
MGEFINIVRARENNLKNVSLTIPKRQITVFTGVSGSGKSSLVFDTIAAEAQRQLNETFTAFVQNFLPKYGQPDADAIENLSAVIIVNQKPLGGNSRSTVGTITDLYTVLRLLFSRVGQPPAGGASAFSFNEPQGMCPRCEGIGRTVTLDLNKFIDKSKSLNAGPFKHAYLKPGSWYWQTYAQSGLFDLDKPLADYAPAEWEALLHTASATGLADPEAKVGDTHLRYEGVVDRFNRMFIQRDTSALSERSRAAFEEYVVSETCPLCHGGRLTQAALASRIDGYNIAELAALEATELAEVLAGFKQPVAAPILANLRARLSHLIDIGLGYLSLDRETTTLSGGESQRIKMVRHLNSSLTDMLYVFDEPSIGLHARDVQRLNDLLLKLRDKGNTVLVVEHDRDVISVADHIVDMGPHAGAHGGEVVYQGSVAGLRQAPTLTGRFMEHALPMKAQFRPPAGALRVANASLHNLKNLTVDLPLGVLTVVTGVAGSGKSTLINEVFVPEHPEAIVIDQSAVGANSRSNPATYTGMLDTIRQLFAKANHVNAGLFSFNSEGACPNCQGLGLVYTDLAFMEGLKSVCEVCGGKRFKEEVLQHKLRGQSISDVLAMTAAEALAFFPEKKLAPILQAINDVGLTYLKLGQPLSTLSGGESQRIKLATELHKAGTLYVMDEPTTGLHMSDIRHLLEIIERLVNQGNSVIVIEHNLDVIKNADWIIDLGPEGGHRGGQVLFEGTPAALLDCAASITGQVLRQHL